MGRVVAVANQKGGVAKTTSVHTLGVALAEQGHRVLLVDLDPQACLTYSTGADPDSLERSLHDVLVHRTDAADVTVEVGGCTLLPATIDLAGAEVHLLSRTGREYALKRAITELTDAHDITLIDCPPSLGILTICGLTAADEVVIPLQCETLSHRGVGQLLDTIDDVRAYTNENLTVRGVIATMYDGRTNLAKQVIESIRETYDLEVFDPPVPKSVRVAEAPGQNRSVLDHASRSKAASAYRALAERIATP
ncbi:MAG: ParA family protein [Acidimicrobiales bacterium]|nr:ParA family protein [Acidimicrobiales bacterium]